MSIRELNKKAEEIGFLSSRQANHIKSFKVTSISKESPNMKKYILNEDCTVRNKSGETVILKGTEVVDKNNYVDEDGGVKTTIANGEFEGMEIIFSIEENKKTDVFKAEDFKTFDFKNLDGKTLLIKAYESENILIVAGTDIKTNITYVLKEERVR